jgi:hypothetical protein
MAIVIAAGLGYWLFVPKMPSQVATYTTQQTSLLFSSQTVAQSSTASSTVTSSATLAETVQWINVTGNQPVSYYLKLLESNDTEPYVQLAKELRRLPDLKNATALAKITYLALNATNPEVKEAFELMMKGGTPAPGDFTYAVPSYNTELQVLYWLACQNEFKKDDTLALAIATANGIWLGVGDDEVAKAVRNDTKNLLGFFRETNELQNSRGFSQLEDYPLEAKVALAWTASNTATNGPHSLKDRYFETGTRLGMKGYKWNTVETSTLRAMREFMDREGLVSRSVDDTASKLEEFFMFGGTNDWGGHWFLTLDRRSPYYNRTIVVDGEEVAAHNIQNVDFEWHFFLEHGKGIGVCDDEMAFLSALCKSWGIATTTITYNNEYPTDPGHTHIVYFAPPNLWKAYVKQLNIAASAEHPLHLFIYKPTFPAAIVNYNSEVKEYHYVNYVYCRNIAGTEIRAMFTAGIRTDKMRGWFFSFSTEYGGGN